MVWSLAYQGFCPGSSGIFSTAQPKRRPLIFFFKTLQLDGLFTEVCISSSYPFLFENFSVPSDTSIPPVGLPNPSAIQSHWWLYQLRELVAATIFVEVLVAAFPLVTMHVVLLRIFLRNKKPLWRK